MKMLKESILFLLVLASPAVSGGKAEEIFHQAYAQEVVQGDVKGAALVYMQLMQDGETPDSIRAEAKFRFAVCAVILGRADEARSHLAELIEDPDTPANVKAKAEEYRAVVDGIGVGTELEKKLQSLVFDLGRANPHEGVDVYRDFEIIGKPAIPFLRKLLNHSDKKLRHHAFRLLMQMGEPGMAAEWETAFGLIGNSYLQNLTKYLTAHPEELAVFEARLLELGDEVHLLKSFAPSPRFSIGFVKALAEKEGGRLYALRFARYAGEAGERHDLLMSWVEGEDEDLARRAMNVILNYGSRLPESISTEERFPAMVEAVIAGGSPLYDQGSYHSSSGFRTWAAGMPTALVLEQFERALDLVVARNKERNSYPIGQDPMLVHLCQRLEKDLDKELDIDRYAALLKRWHELWWEEHVRRTGDSRPGSASVPDGLAVRIANFTHLAPIAKAKRFVGWVVEIPTKGLRQSGSLGKVFGVKAPRDVEVLVAAIRAAAPASRQYLYASFPAQQSYRSTNQALAEAQAEAILDLAPEVDLHQAQKIQRMNFNILKELPRERARRVLAKLIEIAVGREKDVRQQLIHFSGSAWNEPVFPSEILIPVFAEKWDELGTSERLGVLGSAVYLLSRISQGQVPTPKNHGDVIDFVRARLSELPTSTFSLLTRMPDLFPVETWLKYFPPNYRQSWKGFSKEELDRVARAVSEDVATMTLTEIKFVRNFVSAESRDGIFKRGLALKNPEARQRFVFELSSQTGSPATVETLEATLSVVLAEDDPDRKEVGALAWMLLNRNPSEKLFPAASLLLASKAKDQVIMGIKLAASLGRKDLLPDLMKLLDSMDSSIRTQAKTAIDSINELERIKNEQKLKEMGLVPK